MRNEHLNASNFDVPDVILEALDNDCDVSLQIEYRDTDGGGGEVAYDLIWAVDEGGGGGPVSYYELDGQLIE